MNQFWFLQNQQNKTTKKVYNNLIMEENMIMIRDPKTFCFNFDWSKDVDENLKQWNWIDHKTQWIFSWEYNKKADWTIIVEYKHGNNIHDHKKQQNKWATKFVLNLSQRLNLRSSNKHVALQNSSIYYTWKNIKTQYMNNKLKIIAQT